ncbi:MAG: penicillin-binding protein 2 [Klebsiella oxytoca]|nr:penicillin-binding protein 2 [Klebsiella oxytoca]
MSLMRDEIRDHSAEEMLFIRRAVIAFLLVVVCFAVLIVNFYRLQVEQHDFYQTRSNQNDIKMLPIAPSRGLIFDRNGIPLVQNITLYRLQVIPSKIADMTALSDVEVARFAVNEFHFPGVTVESYQQRAYPYGAELAHVVGYVSKINDSDLQKLAKAGEEENYAADHNIGKQGIEGYYEKALHGTTGYQEVEVDNHGRVVRLLKEVPPVAGKNIYLTLDLHLQQYIESVLKGQRAAVVAVDPRDGGVLAMVSSPSYDPNPFVRGIGYQAYRSLLENPDRPLINRVTQGLYPPASTVKPYMALSALSAGVITPTTSFFGAPTWTLPGTQRRYRDWLKSGHGMLNVTKAIEESADTFFYQVAFEMGIDRIHEWLSKFGYGQSTGIDLNEEYAGVLPSREWKLRVHKKPWYQGDTISVGIGQGYWIATPIQMVKALTTLINNGKVQNPHLLYSMKQGNRVERYQPPQNLPQIGDPHSPYWDVVRNGMYGMANLPNGTGYKLFHTAPYQIAAKSGTSQVFSLKENQTYNAKMIPVRLRDHIFYTLFAPYQHPKVAMALILENGGGDGVVAGPTARAILDHIFDPANAPAEQGAAAAVPQVESADAQ